MVVSLRETRVTGVPGATSADGISRAAAMAIGYTSNKLDTNITDPVNQRGVDVDQIAAGISRVNAGTAFTQQTQRSTEPLKVSTAMGALENLNSVIR